MLSATVVYHDDNTDEDLYPETYESESEEGLKEQVRGRIGQLSMQAELNHLPTTELATHTFSIRVDGEVVATFPPA